MLDNFIFPSPFVIVISTSESVLGPVLLLLCLNKKTTFLWSFQSKINIFHYMHLKYFSRLHCGKGGISGSNMMFCISRFTFYVFGFSVYFFLAKIYSYVVDAFIEQLSISIFWGG